LLHGSLMVCWPQGQYGQSIQSSSGSNKIDQQIITKK
jgi:hypothetical protein